MVQIHNKDFPCYETKRKFIDLDLIQVIQLPVLLLEQFLQSTTPPGSQTRIIVPTLMPTKRNKVTPPPSFSLFPIPSSIFCSEKS